MRSYGRYDATRGLTTAVAAGVAGLLLWAATLVGQQSAVRFWEEMGIVAAAGLVMALSQVVGGWTKGLQLRLSPGTFLFGFLPVLVVVGWILMASQPGHGWYEGTVVSWSHNVGLMDVIHSLALWHGVLAFGFGLVLGMSFDTVPAPAPADEVVVDRRRPRMAPAPVPVERDYADEEYADEPVTAERRAVDEEPSTTAEEPVYAE